MSQEEKDRIFAESLMAEEQKNTNNNDGSQLAAEKQNDKT